MVGKNNNYVRESKSNEHFQRFALRKLSVGVVSVAVAAGFYLGSGTTAQAATAESDASAKTEQVVQQDANSTASDSTSASNSSAAVSTSSATPVSVESASSVAVSDSPALASAVSDNQASAANASESSSQSASSSVASDAAATASKDSQAASEANSQSAADVETVQFDVETVQLPTSAANANANESQAANILGVQAVQKAANQQAPAGFTVTDPNYPAEMYKDPDASHYTYWWAQSSNGEYNLVLSTDRNGDGKVYVFLLGRNNNVLGQYTVDKNKSTEVATDDEGDFGTVYNDGQSGVFVSADGSWKSKFNVFDPKAGEDNGDYGSISFMIPQVETQTTTYVDGKGNTVSDPVVQKGLDGQIYTTQGGKVINGYFAKEPSNANGFMSPFGKQGATYTKDWHDGLKATFTETDTTTGLMHVVVKYHYFLGWRTVKEFDLAPGQSQKVHYDLYKSVTIHSIYIPQTINIQYVYEKLGNLIIDSDSKAFPAEDKTTTQYPNDENDSTKAGNVTIPKVPGFTPTINGKTVTNYTFNPADYVSDLSQDITVVYEADWQQAQVNFYDETAGQQIDGTHEIQNGKTGETISFTKDPNEVVKELEAKGYVFDKDNAKNNVFTTGTTYDNDSTVHQYFNYYFKHGTQDVSDTDKEAKTTATRTINVTMPDGKTSSETQTVNYKRTATKDLVNGHITYGQWQADGASAWEEYTPTPQKGYTTLINGVAGTKVAQKTPSFKDDKPVNETVNVTYQADVQRAVIKYIDGETSENLQKTDDIVDGHTNETINYSTADKIKEFVGKGYELVSNDFKPGTKFDNDDKTDQTYTVIFKHHRENVDPNHSSADGTKGTKTLTETVRYKYANGAKAAEDQTAQVTFTRNGVLDDVTGIVAWGKWNEASQSYKALTSPTIAGYTPSEAVVKRSSNSDAEQGPTVTVIYTADAQKVHVQYIDGETDKLLRQDDLDGYTDETIPYSTAEGIKKFEGDGYELFKDNFPAGEKFDNDDKTDQTYTVIFKHHRENVDPNHSSADGTKGTKTLTETVHYKYADGTKAAEDQTAQVTFTRNGVLDDVTGIVAWGKWNEASQSYKALTSPTIAGYTPSEAVVKRSSNSDAEQGPTLTVIYTADAQKVHVQYIDGETDKLLRQDDLDGYTDETIPYSTAEGIKKFEGDGYELFKDNFPAGEKFDNDDKADQTYTVIFKHHRENVDPTHSSADGTKGTKTLTETVHYKYADGTKAAEDQTAQVTFTRNGVLDDVTGIVAWGKWNEASQSYKALTSPTIAGYTPSEAVVKRSSNSDAEQGPTLTVIYTADAQTAYVKYVDDTTGETLRQDDLHGYTDETIPYSTAEGIKKFEGDGYVLVSDGFKPGTKFGVGTPTYEVHFKHGTTHTDATDKNAEQKIVTETIHYVYENNLIAKPNYTSAVDFKRGYTTDKVTGKIISYDPWTVSSKKFGVVKSPAIEGYTPNHSQIDEITVTPDSKDVVETVVYVGNAQEAQAIFYDETTGKEIANTREIATGKTDETINFAKDPNEVVKELEAKGYVFDKDNANNNVFVAGTAYDKNSEVHQYFKYYLKHGHAAVTPDQNKQKGQTTVTQTIKYQYADGTATGLADNVQTLTFKRTGDKDLVTGKVTWPDWSTVAGQQTSAVTSPTLKGYTADTSEIPAATYHAGDSDVTYVVKYSADAQRAVIKYIDGETGKDLQDPDTVDGHTNETINYSTADKIKKYEDQGYELFKDNFPAGEKFDNDDANDQTYTVIFKHHRENVDPNHFSADGTKGTKTLTETVHYKYADGTKAAEDQTAQVTFTRNGVLDDVTGIVAWGKWNEASQSYKALTSPTIAGYTPSETVVKRSSNSDAEQGPTLTVIYTADAQTAYVKYIDDTTGKTLRQDDLHGYTDETIPYSTAEGIKKFESDGYVLVSDGFKPGTKFGVGTPTYEVHFKHGTTHTSATDENADQKTVTETIHYVDENNQTVQPDYTAAVTFKRGYTTDNVTGKVVSYDPWTIDGKQADSKTFAAVTSPAVEGYTPNHQQINEFTVTSDSKDIVKTVVYVGDPQEAQAIFYDETTGKEISNTREFATGKTDETISFTKDPNEVVKELEKQGYVFDKDNANNNVFVAGTIYDKNSEVHQYFKYYFTHATTTVTPDNPKTPADVLPDNPGKNYPSGVAKDDLNKTVTRTINITTPDGKTQTITQKAEFTRSATVDEVTGEVTYGPWSKNVVLESVDVPNIPGYVPSASVPEITVTPNDQDMTINITYKKLDSGKATDQGGNASNGGQATNGGSTTGQSAQNGQSGQTQNNAGAQQLPQTGNANNEKGALGLASAMFAAGLGLGFGSKKKRHED